MSTFPLPSAEDRQVRPSLSGRTGHDIQRPVSCFEHIREQSGQACPLSWMHDLAPDLRSALLRISTRDHPDMFPLHDVLEPAECFDDARCASNAFSETCLGRRRRISDQPRLTKVWWSRTGSNRRPEACKATALPTELRPHLVSDRPEGPQGRPAAAHVCALSRAAHEPQNGGPGRTRTSDLTLIKRAL